jgi:tetratricopeptide (TPR) repeat protein
VEKNKGLWILGIYFFLALYLLPMFPHSGSPSELTQWATAASLVEKTSFDIRWTEDLIGKNTDATRTETSTYSNKAPGTAVLAAPFYALTRLFIGAPNASNIRISWFVMRLFISTLPLLFLGLWLYSRDSDEVSLAALLFATPLFVYSLLLSPHVLVAVLLYLSFRLLYDTERIFLRNCVAAGFLSGFAVTCELTVIVPVLVFAGGLFFADKRNESRWQNVFFFAVGGFPFLVALLIYNRVLFGSWLAFPYLFESFPEWTAAAGQSFPIFGIPTISNFYLLLISPARGLFFFAPVLFLPLIAFFTSRERKAWRHRVKIAAIVASVLVLAGHGAASGGWAFGARYLIFILPLMLDSFFDGEIYEFSNVWQGALFTISFLLCTLPALTFPLAPPEFKYPHNNFWGKFLFAENWFTPNLANVAGLSSGIWAILPVLIALAAVLIMLRRYARRPSRFTIGIFAGLITIGVYFALPNLDNDENKFRRAVVAERFYKPDDRLFKASTNLQTPQRINDAEWLIADTRAFAPDDFPYLARRDLKPSPGAQLGKAAALQKQGNAAEAETILQKGKEEFPFARCELASRLAEIYKATDRKDLAVPELESVQSSVNPASRPDCLRSQFLLGALYREAGETDKANQAFQKFLANTQNTDDAEIKNLRRQIGAN